MRIAALDDLLATKLNTIFQRCEPKDYEDVYALLKAGLSLEYGLGCALAVFGDSFNPALPIKALTYYEDGTLSGLPSALRDCLTAAALGVGTIPTVPKAADHLD